MTKACLKYRMRKLFLPHYLIIGAYSKKPIGCTCGNSGKKDVLEEEPGSTFIKVQRRKCPICKGKAY